MLRMRESCGRTPISEENTVMTLVRKALATFALLLPACSHSSPAPVTPEEGPLAGELVDADGEAAPPWVSAPSTYKNEASGGKLVCGEGSLGGTNNMNMAQTGAAGRARTALARTLEARVLGMLRDYQSTTTGGEQFASAANDEQRVEDATKQITDTTLSGTEIMETWISSKSTLHSLVCLNVERFKDIVGTMQQLDEATRKAVTARADAAWDELDDATDANGRTVTP
jgi:hypothetical protein